MDENGKLKEIGENYWKKNVYGGNVLIKHKLYKECRSCRTVLVNTCTCTDFIYNTLDNIPRNDRTPNVPLATDNIIDTIDILLPAANI